MPKKQGWEKGVGPYQGESLDIVQGRDENIGPSRDISGVVDKNANVNGGNSAGLIPQRGRR
jgi:hypothetical protein